MSDTAASSGYDKPEFDPSQPFETVGEKPAFDPSQPFEPANDIPDHPTTNASAPGNPPPMESEGGLASGVRAGVGAVGGAAGALYGAGVGAEIGLAGGPWGALAGGLIGAVGGAIGGNAVEEGAKSVLGLEDDTQRAINAQAHPGITTGAEMAVGLAGMAPVKGLQLGVRGAGALIQGGMEAGNQLYEGQFDGAAIARQVAAGAVLPGINKLGERLVGAGGRLGKTVAGRPNQPANPAADQAHVDVGAQHTDTAAAGGSTAEEPPLQPDGSSIGNPQSSPSRSAKTYPKDNATIAPEDDMLTHGDMDPATIAALTGEAPRVAPGDAHFADEGAPAPQEPAPAAPQEIAPQPADVPTPSTQAEPETKSVPEPAAPEQVAKPQQENKPPFDPAQPFEPVVDAGFPKEGEPVAVGENELTPVPKRELKGETNTAPTEGQKEAGNYAKAGERLLGHDVKYENMKGSKRTGTDAEGKPWESTVPADYGYFKKTRGADKDHIDVYNADNGEKHFIIDQSNLEKGNFDEHKVVINARDAAEARQIYRDGFSDGKGDARLHDITEVSEDDLKKWLGGHGKSTRKPYGQRYLRSAKPAQERAVVKDAIAKFEAKGDIEKAEALKTAPEDKVLAAIEGKRTRKYGVDTGKSAGYPVEGILNAEGKPVTANSPKEAQRRADLHGTVQELYGINKDTVALGKGAALDKIKRGFDAANSYDVLKSRKQTLLDKGTWAPQHKTKEWLWAREAKRLLAKPTDAQWKKFQDADQRLRGSDEDVENWRSMNRTEAESALNKNTGEKAVERAEARAAEADAGVNNEEDAMAARIDAKAEDETTLPPKEITSKKDIKQVGTRVYDMNDPSDRAELAAFYNKDVETPAWKEEANVKQKTVAEKLAAQRAAREAATAARAGEAVPKVDLKAAEQARKAEAKRAKEAELERLGDADEDEEPKGTFRDLVDRFTSDDSGAGHPGKVLEDMKALLKRTSSYLPKLPKAPPPPPPAAPAASAAAPKKPFWDSKRSEPKTYMPRDLEPGSVEAYQSELSDSFTQHDGEMTGHQNQVLHHLADSTDAVPPGRLAALDRAIYDARDQDALAQRHPGKGWKSIADLKANNPEAYDLYVKRAEDQYAQNDMHADWLSDPNNVPAGTIGPKTGGLHVYRMRKDNGMDPLNSTSGRFKDPLDSVNPLSSYARGTTHEREHFALERDSDGRRWIITPDDDGYHVWDKGKIVKSIADPQFAFKDGDQIKVGNQTLTMRDATTTEIEKNVKDLKTKKFLEYHHSGLASAALANLQLTEMVHHAAFAKEIKDDPRFKSFATRDRDDPRVRAPNRPEDQFVKTKLAEFDGYWMHPKLAHVLDDYAGAPLLGNNEAIQAARKLSVGVMKTMFWNPIIHPLSVGSHFYPARGWDNFTPSGIASLTKTMPKAFNSVVHYDRVLDNRILKAGGSLMYPGTVTKDMTKSVFKEVGISVDKDPEAWDKIANKIGISPRVAETIKKGLRPANALKNAIYNGSQNITWASNDMFYKTLFLEHEAKFKKSFPGTAPERIDQMAVRATEKDLPNYRVAPELMGKRGLSQGMQDRLVSGFGPFHTGVANAYANMVHGMISKESTPQDRLDAFGKLFALAVMGGVIAPILDKGAKKITGNKDSEVVRRSALAVPHEIGKTLQGKGDLQAPVRRLAMGSPLLDMLVQAYNNRDFGDRKIIEPGDVANAVHGNPQAAGRVAESGAGFIARNAVQPVGQVFNTLHKQNGGLGTGVGDFMGLYTNPSPKAQKHEALAAKKAGQDSVSRFKRGGLDPVESAMDKKFGYGQRHW